MRLLWLVLAIATGGAQTATQASLGTIEGRVFNSAILEPISNVQISLIEQIGGAAGVQTSMVTDSEGHFSFKNLAPGRYTVRANRDGILDLL